MNMSIRAETSISEAEFPTHGPLGEEEVETFQFWDFKTTCQLFFVWIPFKACVLRCESVCFQIDPYSEREKGTHYMSRHRD